MPESKTILAGIVVVVILLAAAAYLYMRGPAEAPATETTPPTTGTETTSPPEETTTQYVIRWGTSRTGSSGYRALTTLTKVLGDELPNFEFTVVPTAGAVASMKEFATGQLDGCYAADIGFKEMYSFTGRFEGFKDQAKRMPLQTLWVYTIDIGIAIPKEYAGQFQCWSDLSGKKVFTLPKGWDTGTALRKALDTLGINYEHIELDLDAVATALKRGDIVATGVYITGESSLAPWIRQLEVQVDLVILNPCPDEIQKLREAGIPVSEVPIQGIFSKDVGVDTFKGVRIYYGFHFGNNIPEDAVYQILVTIEKNLDKLAQLDPAFSQIAEDFVGFQVEAIQASKDIPVHPGLAKYLKEKGVWSDEWTIGT